MKRLILLFSILSFGVNAQITMGGMVHSYQSNTIQVFSNTVDLNTATFQVIHPNVGTFSVMRSTNTAQITFSFSCLSAIEINQMVRVDVNAPGPGGAASQSFPIMVNYGFNLYNEVFPCATGPATGTAAVKLINGPATYEVDFQGNIFTVSNDVEFTLNNMQAYNNTLKIRPAGSSCFNVYHLVNSPLTFNIQGATTTSTTAADCIGKAKRFINVNYSGNISYEWFNSSMVSINQFTEEAVDLCPGTYTVKHTHDYTGCSVTSDVTVPEIIPTAIEEHNASDVTISKDLASNLTIHSAGKRIDQIEVFDVSGKLVKEINAGAFDAYISSDRTYKGFYLIIVKLEDGMMKQEKVIF